MPLIKYNKMNSLANKLKIKAAAELYNNRVQNMTQKELIIRCYYKSAQYIETAIQHERDNNLKDFRVNIQNAITIISSMKENLTFYDENGKMLEVASNLFGGYNFIIGVLTDGLKHNSTKDFQVCVKYLNELQSAFEQIN